MLHSVAASEGDTISTSNFLTNYGQNITSVGPYSLNLSALNTINPYSGLTTTTAYQNLSPTNQNGAGLKHFGILSDPTVNNFTETSVTNSLDGFLVNIETPLNVIYVQTGGRVRNEVYNLSGDCYTVESVSITPPTTLTSVTNQVGPFSTCENCESTGCFSGQTDGFYTYIDCCGELQQGSQVGLSICVDTSKNYSGIALTADQCVANCNEGPLSYSFDVSGTCTNPKGGIIIIYPSGGTQPYTVTNTSTTAAGGLLLPQQTGTGPFSYGGVSEGNYVFLLQDSSGGVNQDVTINISVEGCFVAEIIGVTGTTCGDFNSGSLTVTSNSLSSPYQIDLYSSLGLVQSVNVPLPTFIFTQLTPETYYAIVTDFGGATGQTNNGVIVSSSAFTYNLIVNDDSPCSTRIPVGSASVTNISGGTAPFSYSWSNGQTGSTATGLNQGNYSVTVTDNDGCRVVNSFNVGLAESLGVVSSVPSQANCFTCDGQIVLTISGGTAPYTYQGSSGQVDTTNNLNYVFTGLCGGSHSTIITDAGGCSLTSVQNVTSTAGFNIVAVNVTNSDCNNDGSITIQISAPQGIFTYSITDSLGSVQSFSTANQTHTFNNLSSDTYTVTIVNSQGNCTYTTQETVSNSQKYLVGTTVYNAICGNNNGVLEVSLSAGTLPLSLPIDYTVTDLNTSGVVYQSIDSPLTGITVDNLGVGTYQLSVNDNGNCTVTETFNISGTTGVNFGINKTDCVNGDDGTATISIFDGLAPFVISWSNGDSTSSISGLSGGTYVATVVDATGCTQTESVVINCNSRIVTCYELNEICENDFVTTSANIRDFESMLNEGFNDLTSGQTDCTLNTAVFYAIIDLSGGTMTPPYHVETAFYTGTTLNDYPTGQQWIDAIDNILSVIPQIESFTLDLDNNQITIVSDCKELKNVYFRLSTKIVYDITCIEIPTPTPTPTNTLTPTPTPTPTSVVVIDDETEINVFFDDSGSMNGTETPLNVMATTLLKNCLLPFYNNDSNLYDSRVRVLDMRDDMGLNERGYACLATTGTTSSITKVINLAFQDEATPYGVSSGGWTINTPRTNTFNTDIATLRDNIDNNPTNYILGEYFQVETQPTGQYLRFKELLQGVEGGLGQYTGVNGLSDKTEIHNTYDVAPGMGQTGGSGPGSPQYYTDLIITALNNLGYNIPACNPTPTPTPTPTTTPTAAVLNLDFNLSSCARGTVSVTLNNTTSLFSANYQNSTYNNPQTFSNTFNVNIGDVLQISVETFAPTGSGCLLAGYTGTQGVVDLNTTQLIDVTNGFTFANPVISQTTNNLDIDLTAIT